MPASHAIAASGGRPSSCCSACVPIRGSRSTSSPCAKLTAWQLNFTYAAELLYADLVERVGRERASTVLTFADTPSPPAATRPSEAPHAHPLDDEEASEAVAPAGGREGFGSNAWVVDGTRSATRSPVLACDPHLPSGAPSSWYVAHVSGGTLDAIGATLPGIPGIVAGRNHRIAWGTANLAADVQDLFRERLSPDGRYVQCGDRMEPITCLDETTCRGCTTPPPASWWRPTPRSRPPSPAAFSDARSSSPIAS
ncbi:MAG: penicillin acylase family protein, partial [Vicinamibacterales bacterium]